MREAAGLGPWAKGIFSKTAPKLTGAHANPQRAPRAPKDASAAAALLLPKRSGRPLADGQRHRRSGCEGARSGEAIRALHLPPNVELTGARRQGTWAMRLMMNYGSRVAQVPCRSGSG